MNYRDLIEKEAAQVMPSKLPSGQIAIPRGMSGDDRYYDSTEELNDYIDDWNYGYDEKNLPYQKIPENLKLFAGDGFGVESLFHDEDGNIFSYDIEEGRLNQLDKDVVKDMYSTVDVDHNLVQKGKAIPEDKLSRLSSYQKGVSLDEYKEHGLYDKSMAKADRKNSLIKSVKKIPGTVGYTALGAMAGSAMGHNFGGNLKGAKVGSMIGAGTVLGGSLLNSVRDYKNAPINSSRQRAKAISNVLRDHEENEAFLNQYKQACDYIADIEKEAANRDDDMETRFVRDRLAPGLKRLPLNISGMAAGAVLGSGVLNPKSKGYYPAVKAIAGAAVGGALAAGTQRQKALNKLNNKYFGENASTKDKVKMHSAQLLNTAIASNPASAGFSPVFMSLNTPEAIIQKKRRDERFSK